MVVAASVGCHFIWCCGNFAMNKINTETKDVDLSFFALRAEDFFGGIK